MSPVDLPVACLLTATGFRSFPGSQVAFFGSSVVWAAAAEDVVGVYYFG